MKATSTNFVIIVAEERSSVKEVSKILFNFSKEEIPMQRFAEKLRDARAEIGLSQSSLAEETELSIRSISAYETGTAVPRASTL
ncbi:MAG: helix-turn-helix transcriptional regulator, partial [Petrimonas sp.]|nr:helix-turn-helix transcriptional regulator [Petrimonas sp.]